MLLLTCIVHVKKQGQVERKQKESVSHQWFVPFCVVQQYFLYPLLSLFLPSFSPLFLRLVISHFILFPSFIFLFLPPCSNSVSSLSILSLCFSFFRIVLFPFLYLLFPLSYTFSFYFHVFSFSWYISVLFLCLSLCLSCYRHISCF